VAGAILDGLSAEAATAHLQRLRRTPSLSIPFDVGDVVRVYEEDGSALDELAARPGLGARGATPGSPNPRRRFVTRSPQRPPTNADRRHASAPGVRESVAVLDHHLGSRLVTEKLRTAA
jgi:hypothetical protein